MPIWRPAPNANSPSMGDPGNPSNIPAVSSRGYIYAYGFYQSPTSYERIGMGWNSGVGAFEIVDQYAGSGNPEGINMTGQGINIDSLSWGTTFLNTGTIEVNITSVGGIQARGSISPGGAAGMNMSNGLWMGSGVPGAGLGANGDFFFRYDTPGTANQRLYVKSAGAWVATAL